MPYRRVGASGIALPAISLGLWQNFGDDRPLANSRALLRRAFDLGITHFDLANNYGPPYGAAEKNFGRIFDEDFRQYRDELIISTKAGYDQWPGPYGEWGSRKYLLASLDQSLSRMAGIEIKGRGVRPEFWKQTPAPRPASRPLGRDAELRIDLTPGVSLSIALTGDPALSAADLRALRAAAAPLVAELARRGLTAQTQETP